jgi:hypothetical protein
MDGGVEATSRTSETTMSGRTITTALGITTRSGTVDQRLLTLAEATRAALAVVVTWAAVSVVGMEEEASAVVVVMAAAVADIAKSIVADV